MGSQSRAWIYTWNNYEEKDIETLKALECQAHRCAKEIAETGTPHLQGFILFRTKWTTKQLSKILNKCSLHQSTAEKVYEHQKNYCTKGEIVIDFDNKEQGKRNDLKDSICMLKSDGIKKVMEEKPEVYIKYSVGLQKLNLEYNKPPIWREVKVFILIGTPGTGKTKWAYEYDKDLYSVSEPNGDNLWWDGYNEQKTILFDDFYGWIKYSNMLKICDGRPYQAPIKGGFTWLHHTTVIITSNDDIGDWWNRTDLKAFRRRITEIKNF